MGTLISPSSKPIWSHTQGSISHWPPTLQSSPPRKPTTNSSPSPRSPTPASSQPTRWSNAIHDTVNTCLVASFTEVMSSQKTSTPPSPPSKPTEPSNPLPGAQPVSKSASTTNHQPSFQAEIWPRSNEPFAC